VYDVVKLPPLNYTTNQTKVLITLDKNGGYEMKNYQKEGSEVEMDGRMFEFYKNEEGHYELIEMHESDILDIDGEIDLDVEDEDDDNEDEDEKGFRNDWIKGGSKNYDSYKYKKWSDWKKHKGGKYASLKNKCYNYEKKQKMNKEELHSQVHAAHMEVMKKIKSHWKVKDIFKGNVDHKEAKRIVKDKHFCKMRGKKGGKRKEKYMKMKKMWKEKMEKIYK